MDNLYNLINNLQNINNKLDNNILINNNIATFKIKNGNINVINYKDNKRFNTIIQFLIDIANTYKNLELDLHLCYGDYLGANNIDIIDMREESKNDYEKHTFYYGISNDNNDVMRIVNTKPINLPCPVFVFTKEKASNNILFPSLQLINKTKYNSNRKDSYSWGSTHEFEDQDFNLKKRNIPIMRNTNIVADLNNISRIKLLEYSFNNPNILDFKLGSKELHKAFGNYVLDKQFIKLYKYKNIINSNIDTNKFYEWFRCDNYINYDDIIKNNKYIMIGYGGQYLPFYLGNNIIFKYKHDNYEIYEDFIFDNNEIIHIGFDEINNKLEECEKNIDICEKNIKSRHDKFEKYLSYDNLVKHYGEFLLEYSKKIC